MQFIPSTGGNVSNEDRQLFISSVNVVATNTDRDNLIVQSGDVAKVTGDNKTYIYDGNAWVELSSSAVGSLNDLTDVTITTPVNNNVLRYNGANWINGILLSGNIDESTNLYYTDARVDTRIESKFTAKGRLICGSGSSLFQEVPQPTDDFMVLTSDITNILTPTGLIWKLLGISDMSDCLINTPVNGNALVYNGTKWVNSTALSTNINNLNILTGRVNTLEAGVFTKIIDPAVTPYTYTYNQTEQPILKATYLDSSTLIPLDVNLVAANNNINFLNLSSYVGLLGNFVGLTNAGQVATRLMLNGPNFDANTLNGVNYITQFGVKTINLNYSNNPCAPGQYTAYAFAATNTPLGLTVYGLKNANLTVQEMTIFTQPTLGNDWDQIYTTNAAWTTPGIVGNITTVETYFLIRCYSGDINSRRMGAFGFALAQETEEQYQFGNQVTLSNSTGDLVITKTSTLLNAEEWQLSTPALVQYFTQTVVNKVVRSINEIRLNNNTIITDSAIRINNATNSFKIQNSAATNTYLDVDVTNDRVIMARNPYVFIYKNTEITGILNTINVDNALVSVNLGTVDGSVNGTISTLTYNSVDSIFTWARAGTYKVSVNLQYWGQDPADTIEVLLVDSVNNNLIQGGHKCITTTNGHFGNLNMELIATVTLPRSWQFKFRIPAGQPIQLRISSWSVVVTNLFTS